ncbi:MAG TPA: EF-hand domain-containing protein [Ottowia sp.]|uniref:EF-hand domain-containing protein n=1 Tax=Ottowia sp. TaxID=1898956 RepID=UPI002BE3F537|nr:EF-hand domain-containing protein [Ottowia sp.]HMN20261.1 EF-hand domain-containing protein [Ottowia sp.]
MRIFRTALLMLVQAILLPWAQAQAIPPAAAAVAPAASAPTSRPTPAPAKQASPGEQQALKWFHMLDTDGDGRISRREARLGFRIRPSLRQLFDDADRNGDGYLTEDEIRAAADRRRAERQRRRAAEAATAQRAPAK